MLKLDQDQINLVVAEFLVRCRAGKFRKANKVRKLLKHAGIELRLTESGCTWKIADKSTVSA